MSSDKEDFSDDNDDVEEENEDEEDEDDGSEPEEKETKKSTKKRNVSSAAYFLDDEAAVDEDEDEDDFDDEAEEGWAEVAKEVEKQQSGDRAAHRKLTTMLRASEKNEDELTREIEERHKNYGMEDDDFYETSAIKKQSLLPTIKDPKLWMVRCRPGREKSTVVKILKSYLNVENPPIKSAIYREHVKGNIYIEADKLGNVQNAIKNFRTLSTYKMMLVPLKEMPDVLTVANASSGLKRGDWVRVKRGLYRGDIAQVVEYDEPRGRVVVKIIPRMDWTTGQNAVIKGKRKIRMPARFFNIEDLANRDTVATKNAHGLNDIYLYNGKMYYEGYTIKNMNIKSLDTNNVSPTLDEFQKFKDKNSSTNEDEITINVGPAKATPFMKGDKIKVVDGDLIHLTGTVESVDENMVTFKPNHKDIKDLLVLPAHQLQKTFNIGDHVKVISGKFKGETGSVVQIKDRVATLISDIGTREIKVHDQDISECSDVTSGKVKLGNYELHDMVQLNPQTMGVIVKIERDIFSVLDNNGVLQSVPLQQMGYKKSSREAVAYDANNTQISAGDSIRVEQGVHKGKQGVLKHIFRHHLFLYANDYTDNAGIYVAKAQQCVLSGSKMNPLKKRQTMTTPGQTPLSGMGSALRSPARNGFDDPANPQAQRYNPNKNLARARQNDPFLAKTVVILKGSLKGYIGTVKTVSETHARIQLSNCKIVNVPKTDIQLKESLEQHQDNTEGSKTPVWDNAPQTPHNFFVTSTPLVRHAPATPSRTGSVWDPALPNTPVRRNWEQGPDSWGTPGYRPQFTPADSTIPTTPGNFETYNTPGGFDSSVVSPYDSGSVNTPGYQQALTPGTPGVGPKTPAEVSTPHAMPTQSALASDWFLLHGVVVKTKTDPAEGVLRDYNPSDGTCRVEFGKREVHISPDNLEPVPPKQKKDLLIILGGEFKGSTGSLIGIDKDEKENKSDAYVKINPNYDLKILDLQMLAKYQPRS